MPPPGSSHNPIVIDLTDSPPPLPHAGPSRRRSPARQSDVQYTGMSGESSAPRPLRESEHAHRLQAAQNLSSSISAGVYGGANPSSVHEPQPNLTIHEAAPLGFQNHRPTPPLPQRMGLGGASVFRTGEGAFQYVTDQLRGVRNAWFPTVSDGLPPPPASRMSSSNNETRQTIRHHPYRADFHDNPHISQQISEMLWSSGLISPPWVPGFQSSLLQQQEDERKRYFTKHSHPEKVSLPFSRDIVPLDREIWSLDGQSNQMKSEMNELRPVCASCDLELLQQQSNESGRRPWLLVCGHVVDEQCLDAAREREKMRRKLAQRDSKSKHKPSTTTTTTTTNGGPNTRSRKNIISASSPSKLGSSSSKSIVVSDSISNIPEEASVDTCWTQCPVRGCSGQEGNLLARKGSKLAPWEMFV